MKCKFLLLMCATAMLASCVDPKIDDTMNIDGTVSSPTLAQKPQMVFSAEQAIAGEIIVKFREPAIETIESATTLMSEGRVVTGVESIDAFCKTVGAYNIERLFPDAGRFEARQRKAGLHLWYKISFDEGVSMSKVGEILSQNEDLSVVEYNMPVVLPKNANESVEVSVDMAYDLMAEYDELPFNDPKLTDQWHYQNRGTDWKKADGTPYMDLSRAGADVNVVPAWAKCTGSSNVIVAVIDTPVDWDHEDLKDNMWWNEAEKNGQSDVDDDNNGYVDDLFGYSFFYKSGGYMASGSHGTHVAGTVAAVNNNGKGVSGIAGGSGVGDGVRLMSCANFNEYGEGKGSACSGPAIVYACNNGAVIGQCSWSFGEPNAVDKDYSQMTEAIDYFTKYAGTDETGEVQVGPMKGGLLVFAAGNEGYMYKDGKIYPAAEEKVVAVAAMAADYRPSWFTAYGKWVDITAPGGDHIFVDEEDGSYGSILSTESGGTYSYKYGTSMACPHVSGVAALAVSYAEQLGVKLSAEDLKDYIYDTARDIDSYLLDDDYKGVVISGKNYFMYMKDYRGKMGAGLIDANAILSKLDGEVQVPDDHVAPEAVESFEQTDKGIDNATIEWKVTGDYTGAPVNNYRIYWSKGDITVTEKGAVSATTTLYGPTVVAVGGRAVGDAISGQLNKLAPTSEYNVVVISVDKWNKTSQGCFGTITTDDPVAPEAVKDLRVVASTYNSLTIGFTGVADCIGDKIDKYTIRYSTSSSMTSAMTKTVTLAPNAYGELELTNLTNDATYYIEVVATDQFGLNSAVAKTSGKTPKNYAPVLTAVGETTKTLQYWDKASVEFEVDEPNNDKWTAKIVGTLDSYVKMAVEGNKITVTFTGNSQNLAERTYSAKVVVSDESGLTSAQVPFTFNIIGNEAPVAKQIPDLYMGATGQKQSYTLADYFTDSNGETLKYDVAINAATAVARIEGGNLVVEGSKYGLVTVTVTARDAGNKEAVTSFKVMVRDDSKPVELYPNPVVKDLNIRMGQSVKGSIGVRVFSAAGPMAMETSTTIDPFAPAKVDLSALGAGNYVVEVSYGNEVYKSTIVKK